MTRDARIILGLIFITLLAFAGVANCGFVNFDDYGYVAGNPHVLGGLSAENFRWAWKTFDQGNYLPLTWLSFMLDATLFGPDPQPRGFHLMNLAFHTANVVLIFLFFRNATGAVWRSALVAAIFAVHPLRVESVAWVVERKDVLTAFFGFLTMLAYLHFARTLSTVAGPTASVGWVYSPTMPLPSEKSDRWASTPTLRETNPRRTVKWFAYAVMLLLFALSLLAKQTMATLPCVLLLMDYWPLGRWIRGPVSVNPNPLPRRSLPMLILEKLPLLAMSVAIIRVTMKAQNSTHSVADMGTVSLAWRLGNIPISYARYLGKMFWFGNLAPLYPRVPWNAWTPAHIAGSCFLLLAITAICLWKFRSWPWLMIGWLWFLGVLVPMNGIAQFGPQAMADRFTYFAGIGLLVMLAWSIPRSAGEQPVVVAAVAGASICLLVYFTMVQTSYWHDTVKLFAHEVDVAGSSGEAEFILGKALRDRGKPGDIKEAVKHLDVALSLDSSNTEAMGDLALALAFDAQYDKAAPLCLDALHRDPQNPNWHIVHAYILRQTKHPQDAIDEADQAIAINPGAAYAHRVKAYALEDMGKTPKAIVELKKALSINPKLTDGQTDLKRLEDSLKNNR